MNGQVSINTEPAMSNKRKRLMLAALAAVAVAGQAIAQGGDHSGKEVVDKVCAGCHASGAGGAPRIGDAAAWSKRASQGLTSLTQHALEGIRKMPAHGGNPGLTDLEIGRAVTYMVNRSGGRWVEPASAKDMAAERSGEQIVKAQCANCHESGAGGAPRIGDRSAWIARVTQGLDYVVRAAIRGHGGMPARGGMAEATDGEIRAAILYMFNQGVAAPSQASKGTSRAAKAPPAIVSSNQKTVDGTEIYLGFVSAETLRSFPKNSIEAAMHGGVPRGAGYYHVNVSLLDAVTKAPITDAQVDMRVEQPGLTAESKHLEPVAVNKSLSYGNYFRMRGKSSYLITVKVRKPGSLRIIEAKFEHRFD